MEANQGLQHQEGLEEFSLIFGYMSYDSLLEDGFVTRQNKPGEHMFSTAIPKEPK